MSLRSTPDATAAGAELPSVVPFDLSPLTRLSSPLGERVVADDESFRRSEWVYADGSWSLSVFDVTDYTVVLRVRTPVGCQRFYGAIQADIESVEPQLEAADGWQRRQ
ncbi:hypothetical protein [Halapricum hydrolyticum]|uniref:Uncharacterized protein n=1 Tax=Halapricum hydrolyticum TaxID=2979991 RepID=A0AAE3ID59_9EURY|nr:hypothetical protein [Halapricum hydrolyticum]MCU4719401.1 hypothetical protein [Halapricum hydrolyticum]MCU4728410.1 hypothetical protein [Halapricum hydrolyticum]